MSLETLALLAAAMHAPLRETVAALDLDHESKSVADALKIGRQKDSRETVRRWLLTQGVKWDGRMPIGEAVVAALKRETLKSDFKKQVQQLRMLSSSTDWLTDEQLTNGSVWIKEFIRECCRDSRESDTRPGGEVHSSGEAGD